MTAPGPGGHAGSRAVPAAPLFPALFGLAVLALTSWPYAAGYLAGDAGARFLGFVDNASDGNPYVSWVRQAAAGRFHMESLYSPERVAPHLVNLMTSFLGGLARIAHLSPVAAYETGRVLFAAGLLWTLWWASGVFLGSAAMRRFAFAWMSLGAGLGWTFILTHGAAWLDPPRPLDLRIPEASAFYSMLTFPHLAASMALMAVALVGYFTAVSGPAPSGRAGRLPPLAAMIAAAACLLLGGFHPYPLLVIAGTAALYAATRFARRRGDAALSSSTALLLAGAALGLGWNLFMFSRDPVLAGWKAQNITPSLHPLQYLLGLGPGLWLLPWAAPRLWRHGSRESLYFLASWILVTLAANWAPLPFQRRLIEGIGIPLALTSAMALETLRPGEAGGRGGPRGPAGSRRVHRAVALAVILAVSVPSSLLLVERSLARAQSRDGDWFISRDEAAAMEWLGAHAAPGSVVLASTRLSNRVPRFTDCRVFAGHFCQTLDFARRARQVEALFAAPIPDEDRRAFLRGNGIGWLVVSPDLPRRQDPATWTACEPAFRSGEVQVFRVRE